MPASQKKKRPAARTDESRRSKQNSAGQPQQPGRQSATNTREGRNTRKRNASSD